MELCTRINATENIRGVNYRLMKRGFDLVTQADQARAVWHASYASIHTDHDDAACNLIFPPIYTSF